MPKNQRYSQRSKSMSKRLKGLERKVGQMTPELKHFDTLHSNVPVDTTGSRISLISLNQGVQQGQRLGNAITLKKFEGIYRLTAGAAFTIQPTRIFIVKDMDPADGGVPPPLAGVTGILSSSAVESLINSGNHERFRIIADRMYSLESTAGSGVQDKLFKWTVSLHNARQDYKGVNPTDFINTAYWLVAVGDVAAPSGTVLNGQTRLYYTDA